jgi:hypothetical protein
VSDQTPTGGQPEFLEQGGGHPLTTPPPPPERTGGRRRKGLILGGVLAAAALIGGGVWAATSFFSQGEQPAEALPAGTIGYASIDLDPSGGQKIEAFKMLRRFPAFREQVGLNADDDLKKKAFESMHSDGFCPDLSYSDLDSWLGDRFAMAAVDLGEQYPTPVGVIQVTDDAKAEAGLKKIQSCEGGSEGTGGFVVDGGWAVVAETESIAQQVVDKTGEGTLAADGDYQKWTGELGDPGVVNMYAAPEAGKYLAEMAQQFSGMASQLGSMASDGSMGPTGSSPMPPAMTDQLKDFPGLAMTLRFNDGALELAAAGGTNDQTTAMLGDGGVRTLMDLPADTAAAASFSLGDGWVQKMMDQFSSMSGMSSEEMISQLEQESGMTLPEDLQTLLGDSATIALSSSFTPDDFVNSSDGSDVPVGMLVHGDADAIGSVLDKVAAANPTDATVFGHDASGDDVAIGPNSDYRAELLKDGGLGASDTFQNLVPEADKASIVMFVNFDAGDWLVKLAQDDAEAKANLQPLQGLGISTWIDGDSSHFLLRLTTE